MSRQTDRFEKRKGIYGPTSALETVEIRRRDGSLALSLANFSHRPKGVQRIKGSSLRQYIWPEGKIAKPGRMG